MVRHRLARLLSQLSTRDFDSGSSCKPFLLTLFGVLCWCYWLLVVGLASCCCCVVRVSRFQAILRCVFQALVALPIACPSRLPYPCHPCRRDLLFIAYIIDFCTLFDIYLVCTVCYFVLAILIVLAPSPSFQSRFQVALL